MGWGLRARVYLWSLPVPEDADEAGSRDRALFNQ